MQPPPPPPLTSNDEEQSLWQMQRELGKALRISFGAVSQERLPERMVLLLLRLALAQAVRGMLGQRWRGRKLSQKALKALNADADPK